jgi:hypothetical protein
MPLHDMDTRGILPDFKDRILPLKSTEDRLTVLLFLLVRDHIPISVMYQIIHDIVDIVENSEGVSFSDEYLYEWAKSKASRLSTAKLDKSTRPHMVTKTRHP